MANFKTAYFIGRENEGGYSNRKADKGGETYAGVSRVEYPNWPGWCFIDAYKKSHGLKQGEHVSATYTDFNILEIALSNFYKKNFWDRIQGDHIIDQQVANLFYDWSLTSGGAIKKVQKIVGANPDGQFGPASVTTLNQAIAMHGAQWVFENIKEARKDYYVALNQPENINGWLNRVAKFNYKADDRNIG